MKMRIAVIALCAAALGLNSSSASHPSKTAWTIYLRRAGQVRFGMSLSEVRQVLGDPDASLYVSDPANPLGDKGCTYLESTRVPERLGLMFDGRRVVRVDVSDRPVAQTASGARVGDTEQRIQALYPKRIRVEPHHYDPAGHYLIYVPSDAVDKDFGIVFETDGKRVTSFRVGFSRATARVEGCS